MQIVVGVKFQPVGKIYYFAPKGLTLKNGDGVIVETARGIEYGVVEHGNYEIEEEKIEEELKPIIRIATEKDLKTLEQNKEKEREVFKKAEQIIKKHNLEMKLINAEYTFDLTKIIFTFSAEDRVDFRELLKDLAAEFRVRIELRQIGIRDEAKFYGGIGPCGQEVCCHRFLNDFEKVSIKMAKCQNLSLNPTKISGLCGRLMCCLAYENDYYAEVVKQMPKINSVVKTGNGEGVVTYNNLLKKIVSVKFTLPNDTVKIVEYPLSEITFEKPNVNTNIKESEESNED